MNLREQFLIAFNKDRLFTTDDVYRWYKKAKSNPHILPDRGAIHRLILNPLLHKGAIQRLDKGLWTFSTPEEESVLAPPLDRDGEKDKDVSKDEDEWEKYINRKLKEVNR